MTRSMVWGLSVAVLATFAGYAAAELKSGLEAGDPVGPFYVRDVTGPKAGTSLCYRCQYRNDPVVAVFARKDTPNLESLVKKIDGKVGENKDKKLRSFVIFLTEDADKTSESLKKIAGDHKIKNVPLTLMEGLSGPDGYNIAKDAEVTVMLWTGGKVKSSHGFGAGKLDKKSVEVVVAEVDKLVK